MKRGKQYMSVLAEYFFCYKVIIMLQTEIVGRVI